jgi:hypothetical protein
LGDAGAPGAGGAGAPAAGGAGVDDAGVPSSDRELRMEVAEGSCAPAVTLRLAR